MSTIATEPGLDHAPPGVAVPDRHALVVRRSDALPVSAWLAEIHGRRVSLLCGEGVEVFDDGLVEGCWDSAFEACRYERAVNLFGSGLKLLDRSILLLTPSHTLEALYLHETADRVVASNSLVFLLEHESLEPPPEALICRRLATLALGVVDYERVLFTHAAGRVLRLAFATVELRDGRLHVRPRMFERHFTDFSDYKGYLLETLRAVFENGASPGRRWTLRPITSVSSGYDSTASAALAVTLGCQQGLTLTTARKGAADTGRFVAEALGIEIFEFERMPEGTKAAAHDEAEFLATGMGGEDVPFAAFEEALHGRIFLTGFHGDKVWERGVEPNAVLARGDLSGSSLAEFRLRTGFVNVPVPFIGAPRHDEIRRITLSEEMTPWQLRTGYDRPIPRRIAEEAGVPRDLFGKRKKAASVLVFQKAGNLSQSTREELRAFAQSRSTITTRWTQGKWLMRFWIWRYFSKLARVVGIRSVPIRIQKVVVGGDWRIFAHSSPLTSELAFRWSFERIRLRYRSHRVRATQ